MTGTTIIYIIISVLSLILGIKTNDPGQIQKTAETVERIVERKNNELQKEKRTEKNATDIRP